MHLHTACLLACVSLQLSGAVGNWEVINDVKPYDESGTQDDILSREEFLPFRASKPRPKPAPQKNVDSSNSKKVTKAPSLPVKGGNYIGEEELLPLGVQNHGNRRLLQVPVVQGPKLSPEMELLRRQLPSEAVNLSSACKESDDSDCLFNVDEYLAKQITSRTLEKAEQDFEFDDKERDIVHVRHKRQAQTAPDPDDINDEGSGTSDTDNVYTNTTAQVDEGQYYIKTEVGFIVGGATVTDEQKKQYQNVIENQMAFIFSSIPGFSKTIVGELVLENGRLKASVTLVIDGRSLKVSANNVRETNLEEFLLNSLKNAAFPQYNKNITINFNGMDLNNTVKLDNAFLNQTRDKLYDYCSSNDPCPDGPEYNITECVNTGFMSGYCPHKCAAYPCRNKALCELNENYEPICNCGDLFEGAFCEVAKEQEQGLTTGETVGVGLAGFAVAALLLSCCVYIVFFRRNKGVKYTYYEDEGSQDNLTDPTSIANYYIDRPIISATPIPVFNSHEGFDA